MKTEKPKGALAQKLEGIVTEAALKAAPRGYTLWGTYKSEERAKDSGLRDDKILPIRIGKAVVAWGIYGKGVPRDCS